MIYMSNMQMKLNIILLFAARINIWTQFEDLEVLDLPVGKLGMILMVLLFRNPLLYLIGFSRGIISLNSYLTELNAADRFRSFVD
jgi:hypothetical protein